MTNPTTPGMHNHIHPARRPHDPNDPRAHIDLVFGDDAPIIEGLPIEVGHGALAVADQLTEHLRRIWRTDGADAGRAMLQQLFASKDVDAVKLKAALVQRSLGAVLD